MKTTINNYTKSSIIIYCIINLFEISYSYVCVVFFVSFRLLVRFVSFACSFRFVSFACSFRFMLCHSLVLLVSVAFRIRGDNIVSDDDVVI